MSRPIHELPQPDTPSAQLHWDLDSSELYLNRELTWLSFNERVLHEAEDPRTPLLERVKFLAISDRNLDEFFMKRIGGLKHQLAAGVQEPTVDGRTPADQIEACQTEIARLKSRQEICFQQLIAALAQQDLHLVRYATLEPEQRSQLCRHYLDNIFPMVTPLAMDPTHPFPFISNFALNLLVTMHYPGETDLYTARVKVPISKDVNTRLIRLDDSSLFVTLEEVMANNLDLLFPGMEIESCALFRVTRNANVERQQEKADDLLEMIETELRDRHFAPIVRLEVMPGMSDEQRGMLTAELGLDPSDVHEVESMLALGDLMEIASLDIPGLRYPPHHPIDHPMLASDPREIFHVVRDAGQILLQHPYESFSTSVERLLRSASADPKVLAIKMTVYRTSARSDIMKYLIRAARNGKQVAVMVEVTARFDEAANISWARQLEEAGIHVTYGVLGLKTHAKIILIVRKDYDGLRRYGHIGTGNYNAVTARAYCDLGLISADREIADDLTRLFNYLTGYSPPPSYHKILAAPYGLKKAMLKKIDREISLHSDESPGLIQFKMNALEDVDITRALYRACQAGVKVDMVVRDTCRFRSGLPGLSDTARVISVVGRFLEHSRVYYFHNGGDEEYYIGSADMMGRNLQGRVEVLVPVEDREQQQDLRLLLDAQLGDRRSAWEMQPDGSYLQRQPETKRQRRGCQQALIKASAKRLAGAVKHKQKKVRKKLLNRFRKRLED